MNLYNLKYFVDVAEELSITNAAKKNFISQQAMSKHVSNLEDQLGVKLFIRTQPISLTEAGERFLCYSKQLLVDFTDISNEIRDTANSTDGELSIGVTNAIGNVFLPIILPIYRQHYPNAKIKLFEGYTSALESALYKKEIDVLIGQSIEYCKEIDFKYLYDEGLVLIASRKIINRLSGKEKDDLFSHKNINLEIFKNVEHIKVYCGWTSKLLNNYCNINNLKLNIALESSNINTCINLSFVGEGVFICPETFLIPHINDIIEINRIQKEVYLFPFEYSDNKRQIGINYNLNKYQSYMLYGFLKLSNELGALFNQKIKKVRSIVEN